MLSTITWAGQVSSNFGIMVERFPSLNRPARKYEKVSVPGRNGDLFFYQDAYENYEQEYEIFSGSKSGSAPTNWQTVFSWLYPAESSVTINDHINLTVNGYHQLIDSYEPNYIRLASFNQFTDVENSWNRYGRAAIRFDCRPERFTSDAFTAITKTTSGGTVTNPTDREAKPFLKVYGSGSATLTINSCVVSISNMTDYLHIDCDSQNCYRLLTENRNSLITLTTGFPTLDADDTSTISWSGGITKVEIYPRWWKL